MYYNNVPSKDQRRAENQSHFRLNASASYEGDDFKYKTQIFILVARFLYWRLCQRFLYS